MVVRVCSLSLSNTKKRCVVLSKKFFFVFINYLKKEKKKFYEIIDKTRLINFEIKKLTQLIALKYLMYFYTNF